MYTPESVNSSVDILAEFGDEHFEELRKLGGWFNIADGCLVLNNEYTVDPDRAVYIALLLLGCARRLKKI